MSERRYQRSPSGREWHESRNAEPEWTDFEASKVWLEERYPLLPDTSLGSPLFRYMKSCVKDSNHIRGTVPTFLASMLSFHESVRYSKETNLTVGFDPKQEKLYPDYGFPDQDHAPEPDWSDMHASRTWLEQRYPLGRSLIGSPLFRYMQACRESRHPMSSPTTSLGLMLSNSEWQRFCRDYPNSARHRHPKKPDPIVLYSEYDDRIWPTLGPTRQSSERAKLFPSGWPHTKPLPQPPVNPPMFADSYPPHLKRRSPSDTSYASPDYPANKRLFRRQDSSGGVAMLAKPPSPYEGYDGPRQQNNLGLMAPPPVPRRKADSAKLQAGAMNIDQQRNNRGEGSSSRQDTIIGTKAIPRPRHGLIEARQDSRVLDPNRSSAGMQTADPARHNDGSVEMWNTSDPVQISAVLTKTPVHAHNASMLSKTKTQHDQEFFLEEEEEEIRDLGHRRHGQHKKIGPSVQSENNEPAKTNPSHLRLDPKSRNKAHVEEDPDAMDIDSDNFGLQTSASPNNIPPETLSRKRIIEDVEDEQPASFPSKKRRPSPETSGDDSLTSSPTVETPLANYSRKSSIEGMDDPLPASSPSENKPLSLDSGGDESPTSSASTETQLADPSRKRSLEEVEDAPPTTSSPKRKRKLLNSGVNELPPSTPSEPPERSMPTPFPDLDKRSKENGTTGEIPDPAPLRRSSYEDPMRVILKPTDIEGPVLLLGLQSESTHWGRNLEETEIDDRPTANLGDRDASPSGGSEMQKSDHDIPITPDPEPRDEHHIHVEENPDDVGMDSEHHRNQTTTNVNSSCGDKTIQKVNSVVIPLQTSQRQRAANRESLPDEDTMDVPVMPNKHKGEGKPGTKGRKARQLKPQLEQGKRKLLAKGWKNRQLKSECEQQAYVGRLRSGVGERKHQKPSKHFIPAGRTVSIRI